MTPRQKAGYLRVNLVIDEIPEIVVSKIFEAIRTRSIWTEFIDVTISNETKGRLRKYNFITVSSRTSNEFKVYVPSKYWVLDI